MYNNVIYKIKFKLLFLIRQYIIDINYTKYKKINIYIKNNINNLKTILIVFFEYSLITIQIKTIKNLYLILKTKLHKCIFNIF